MFVSDRTSSCDRQDEEMGRRTVPSEFFTKLKLWSRAPLSCRHLLRVNENVETHFRQTQKHVCSRFQEAAREAPDLNASECIVLSPISWTD